MKCAVLVVVVVLELFPGNFLAVLPGTGDGEWPRKEVRSYLATSTINSFTPGRGDTVPDTRQPDTAVNTLALHSFHASHIHSCFTFIRTLSVVSQIF